MRTFLWLSTIIGLLPLISLVTVHLSMIALVHWSNSDPDTTVFVGDTQASVASLKPVHLSSSPWPSLLILLGVAVVIVGLWFLTRAHSSLAWEPDGPARSVYEDPPGNAGG